MMPISNHIMDYTTIRGCVSLGDKTNTLPTVGIGSRSYLKEILHVPKLTFELELHPLFGKKLRVKLNKAIYGEKQSAMLWHEKFHKILTEMGLSSCPVTNCLYKYKRKEEVILLTVHVDDGLIAYNSDTLLSEFHTEVNKHLTKLSIVSPLQRYLGVNIDHNLENGKIHLSQTEKIDNIVQELLPNASDQRSEKIPMSATTNLRKSILNLNNQSLISVFGKLRFLADRTRIDILTATGELGSKGATTPSEIHIDTAIKCINYLRCT